MKVIAPALFMLLLLPTANATAQGTDPLSLLNMVIAAQNSCEIDKGTALYTDDAVITNTRGRKVSGKEAIHRFIQGNCESKIQLKVINPQALGDAVTWTYQESTDFYIKLGLAPVVLKGRLVAQGGKIKSITNYFPPTTWVRIRRACENPQAQGVLLYGQSCSEFLQQSKAQTERVAATLKPYSSETDYKSLQGYLSPLTP